MIREALKNLLNLVGGILRMPFVDFEWDMEKYKRVFQKLDMFRQDGDFTDEELGELFEELGEGQTRILRIALYGIGGLFKSKIIDFTWDVSKYEKVFDRLNHMRADDVFTDEELAEFCSVLADSL